MRVLEIPFQTRARVDFTYAHYQRNSILIKEMINKKSSISRDKGQRQMKCTVGLAGESHVLGSQVLPRRWRANIRRPLGSMPTASAHLSSLRAPQAALWYLGIPCGLFWEEDALREISNPVDKNNFYCYFINKEHDFMQQHLMTFIIKIFHLQVNSFSGQMMRWSFWIQPEPTSQTLSLDEHMQIMPSYLRL